MEKKGILDRFKRLSKPTGSVQWAIAIRAVILMFLAALIALYLGFDKGIPVIMFVTLLASMIIDIALPIKKVAILALVGFFMTVMAFICAYLALSSFEIFIFFTVIWTFFSISMYIFGSMEGSIGFIFFLIYFVAVLMVNGDSNMVDWVYYCLLSYLVVSILFIPKLLIEKRRIREMVSVGFQPSSSIQSILATRSILTGISLNSNNYHIFKLGSSFRGFRIYSDLIKSRLSSKSRSFFEDFLKASDGAGMKISENLKSNKGSVNLTEFKAQYKTLKSYFLENEDSSKAVLELSKGIGNILKKSSQVLSTDPGGRINKIESTKKSLGEVLGANLNLKNLYIRHAIRFTIAITIGLIFIYLTRERNAIWITMGILIILKPDITSTIDNLISRVGFNLFAIIVAIIISIIFPHGLLIWLAFIMLFLFRAFYPGYMGLSVMAITVFIVLIWPTGTVFENAIIRLVDICIGGIIAFICAYVILPSRITVNLPQQLIKTLDASMKYADEVLVRSFKDYDHKKALKCFQNCIMEDNNLEAGIRKMEDTFDDISDDIKLYNEIKVLNQKFAADLTVAAALLEKNPEKLDNIDISEIRETIHKMEIWLNRDIDDLKSPDFNKTDYSYHNSNDELAQLLNWILDDIQMIVKGMEIAHETGSLSRYRKLI